MRKGLLIAVLLGFVIMSGAINLTQDLANEKNLSVGDRFQLNIRADVSLKSVVVPDTITNFHVHQVERKRDGQGKIWLQLTLVPLLPGSHVFPSIEVKPERPGEGPYNTDRVRVFVIPVRETTDQELRGLKPLEKYPWQLPYWAYLFYLSAIPLLLALFFIIRARRVKMVPKSEQAPLPEPVKPEPAWKKALRELAELRQLELIAQEQHVRHHYELSFILRRFLARKYRFTAVEMTTTEIMWVLERIKVEDPRGVVQFLRYCDKIKFSRFVPTAAEIEAAENWLVWWLQAFEVLEARQKLASEGAQLAPLR